MPRFSRWAIPSLALFLVAVGCGEEQRNDAKPATERREQTSPALREVIMNAVRETDTLDTYRVALTMSATTSEASGSLRGEGVFDTTAGQGQMHFDASGLEPVTGSDFGEMDTIIDGDAVFLRMPALQREQPDLKPWLKVDPASQEGGSGVSGIAVSQGNPAWALTYAFVLAQESQEVEKIGVEEVRGIPTTRYRMLIDLAQLGETTRSSERVVPNDVWIDMQGRIRRMELSFGAIQVAGGRTGDLTFAFDLYDVGLTVRVRPPPASQVGDFADVE